jgi:hypothetical protein
MRRLRHDGHWWLCTCGHYDCDKPDVSFGLALIRASGL